MNSRTAREWLDLLPEPYRTQALAHAEQQHNPDDPKLDRPHDRPSSALLNVFEWENVEEGESYWNRIYLMLQTELLPAYQERFYLTPEAQRFAERLIAQLLHDVNQDPYAGCRLHWYESQFKSSFRQTVTSMRSDWPGWTRKATECQAIIRVVREILNQHFQGLIRAASARHQLVDANLFAFVASNALDAWEIKEDETKN